LNRVKEESSSGAGTGWPEARQRLLELRQALLHLHKALIDSEKVEYERTFGSIGSPADFLQLLIRDPWFTWLQPLSELIVQIDETLDEKTPPPVEIAETFLKNVRVLLTPGEERQGFPNHYFEALQRDPNVVMAHAEAVSLCGKAKP
jgi:hypothetical protein